MSLLHYIQIGAILLLVCIIEQICCFIYLLCAKEIILWYIKIEALKTNEVYLYYNGAVKCPALYILTELIVKHR